MPICQSTESKKSTLAANHDLLYRRAYREEDISCARNLYEEDKDESRE